MGGVMAAQQRRGSTKWRAVLVDQQQQQIRAGWSCVGWPALSGHVDRTGPLIHAGHRPLSSRITIDEPPSEDSCWLERDGRSVHTGTLRCSSSSGARRAEPAQTRACVGAADQLLCWLSSSLPQPLALRARTSRSG